MALYFVSRVLNAATALLNPLISGMKSKKPPLFGSGSEDRLSGA